MLDNFVIPVAWSLFLMWNTQQHTEAYCSLLENTIIAYVHQCSPMKTSQNKNQYFDLKLQTATSVYRTVCFSPERHKIFKAKSESSSPVKLTKHQLKKNPRSNEEEVHVTKTTRVEDTNEEQIDFDYAELLLDKPAIQKSALDLKAADCDTVANVSGRVTLHAPVETLNIKGKSLQKQEATFTDESGSIRVVLWENDIKKVVSGQCYEINKIAVRCFDGENYLTLTRESSLVPTANSITRADEDCHTTETEQLHCPPEGLNYIQRFLSCKKCYSKLVIADWAKKVIQCTNCNLSQLRSKCQDKIEEMYTLYKQQSDENGSLKPLDDLDDDELTEVLLTVEPVITLNSKKTLTKVEKL